MTPDEPATPPHGRDPGDESKASGPGSGPPGGRSLNEQIQHVPVSARVPAGVARGVFSTGAVVFEGPNEFVLDFVLRLGAPHSVAARVVMPHQVLLQFLGALRENVKMFDDRFGKPAALPPPPPGEPQKTTIADLYEQLKLPDEMLSGVYANAVMIGHTASEFWFDFISNFYPRSCVSARVFLSAQQVPVLLETLNTSHQAHLRKLSASSGTPDQQSGPSQPQQPPPPSN
ncbi:MAG TPA: DUF3467 domain-containing protein [Pirellulales bacterium]|jgi:hypothetical protein|nr:DUF3467 domain-containing protein [Pirellulales bacterium]